MTGRVETVITLDHQYQTAKLCAAKARKNADKSKSNSDRSGYLALSHQFDRVAFLLDKKIGRMVRYGN